MKRVIQAILILAFILVFGLFIFFFAKMRQENLAASLPVAGRVVDIGTLSEKPERADGDTAAAQRSKINPEWGETFLDAIDMNLDNDEDLEQVLIVKPSGAEKGRISIVIADFQPATSGYFRLWKGETLATKPNAFVVQPRDLLADGSVDLLCYGIDEGNKQTLTIFKRISPYSSSYYTAFSASGLSIGIEDPADREEIAGVPMADKPLSPPGALRAVSINVFEEARGGSSPLDEKKITYSWDPARKLFERGGESFVPGASVEKLFIDKIITGRAEDFDDYLKGLWVKEDGTEGFHTYVDFDPEGRKISIHSEQEQQQWDWGRSTPGFAGIYAPISNSAVPEMLRLLGIDLVGMDRVRIRATTQQIVKFAMKEDWNGVYRRPTNDSAAASASGFGKISAGDRFGVDIDGSGASLSLKLEDFNGSYASDTGVRLDLAEGKFSMDWGEIASRDLPSRGVSSRGVSSRGVSSRGFFSLFDAGDAVILDLSLIDEESIPSGRLSFIVGVRPGKNDEISALILQPARVLADGVERLYEPDLSLEKLDN
ncbi:MAG TPA: pallilysin-related adhesin [Rectinemataceae bacterium]|nr:pallilysin-related adhesin [Rectinemataceae bacterium]